MKKLHEKQADLEDPSLPLRAKLWTDEHTYTEGHRIKFYLRGNKPFYARILYEDAERDITQLLPNPYRKSSHFLGGVTYEIPSNEDRYILEVTPPFGEEFITLYASTKPLGRIKKSK